MQYIYQLGSSHGSASGTNGIHDLSLTLGASLMTQMVNNLPSMQESQVWSLVWEDPMENGLAMLKLKLQYFGHLMRRVDSLEKTLMLGGIGGRRRRGRQKMRWLDVITDSMDEFEWTPGVGDGQGGLACCDSWGRKELDTTERLNWTELTDPLQYSCLENSMDRGAWRATVHGVTKGRTQLSD